MFKKIDFYIAKTLLKPFFIFTAIMIFVIWIVQMTQFLELVLKRSDAFLLLCKLSFLTIIPILPIILPISLVCACFYGIHRLFSDSELISLWGAGCSRLQVGRSILFLGGFFSIFLLFLQMFLSPSASKALRENIFTLKTDIVFSLLQEGQFMSPQRGVTLYIKNIKNRFQLNDVFIHENRLDNDENITYIAKKAALLLEDPENPRILMLEGQIQHVNQQKQLSVLSFEKFTFELKEFIEKNQKLLYKVKDLTIAELLSPASDLPKAQQNKMKAKGHEQIYSSFYPLMFMMMIVLGLVKPLHPRFSVGRRLLSVASLLIFVRLLSLVGQNLAAKNIIWIFYGYLVPFLIIMGGIIFLIRQESLLPRVK